MPEQVPVSMSVPEGPEAVEGFNVSEDGRVWSRTEMVGLMEEFGLEEDEAGMFCDDFGLYEGEE
jgi:hypothetical protein